MTGVLVGALLGTGLFLVWWSMWPDEGEGRSTHRESRLVRRLRDDDRRSIAELARLFRVSQNTIRRA